MASNRAPDKPKDNAVRRVVKQGLFHICGLCGNRYGNEAQAEACLEKCIKRYMAQEPIANKQEKTGTVYRCTYCKRVYDKMLLAKECAKTCKQEIQRKIEAEARYKAPQSREEKLKNLAAFAGADHSIAALKHVPPPPSAPAAPAQAKAQPKKAPPSGEPVARVPVEKPAPLEAPAAQAPPEPIEDAPVHPAEGSKFDREGHSYRCHECHQKYKKYQEAIACYDRHREQAKAGVAKKKDSDSKFFRDGAKYVCKKCNSKYFGRDEVVACFDGHKEEEEVWVTGPAAPKKTAKEIAAAAQKENLENIRAKRSQNKSEEEKFFRDGAKYVCRSCNKKQFTKAEVIQCFDSHGSEAAAEDDTGPTLKADDLAAANIEQKAAEVKTGRNREGEDKFFRDSAKYVCKKCNTKYFTRGEVIQCYDKH